MKRFLVSLDSLNTNSFVVEEETKNDCLFQILSRIGHDIEEEELVDYTKLIDTINGEGGVDFIISIVDVDSGEIIYMD